MPFHKPYKNPYEKNVRRSFIDWVRLALGRYNDLDPSPNIPSDFAYPQFHGKLCHKSPKVTWINHSTFLIESENIKILTDPIWSSRCSPISFIGPKRSHAAGIAFHNLPKIDIVLISHNHYDHLDKPTVKALHKKYPDIFWVIPKKMSCWFERLQIKNVHEFEWWDSLDMKDFPLKITAVPTQHFSCRHIFDSNKTPWNGYVIEFSEGIRFYFAGDTGYNPVQFQEIGEAFQKLDLSIIPIGTYTPKRFMSPVHISPYEAVHIHREVNSQLSVGAHHLTFPLSKEKKGQPPFDLYLAMEEAGLDHNTFRVLQPGQTINW